MPVIRPQKNGLHVRHVVVRPVRKRACTCEPTSCCIVMLMLVGAAGIAAGIMMIITSTKQGWGTAALCTAPNGWHCEFYQNRRTCKTRQGIGVRCSDVGQYIPTFFGEEAFLSPALAGLTSRVESPNSSHAAGTKSSSPQSWSSATKRLRRCWAR